MRFLHSIRSTITRAGPFLFLLSLTGCGTISDFVASKLASHSQGKAAIVIELKAQEAYLYKGTTRISTSKISTGREGHNTPVGQFSVLEKDIDHHSSVYGYYADTSGHLPGYPASHGCVRMPYWKARQFYETAKIGTPVTVKP